jgi:integrase
VAAEAGAAARSIPTFHEYASYWLQARTDGVLGDKPIEENTRRDYLWRLRGHLLPFFAPRRLDEIDPELCLAFKAHKVREAADLRTAITAGADLRDHRGRHVVPLGPSSIRKLIDTLAAILDDAIEDGHIERNPARGRRMRVRVPKPQRTFLELDELPALIDAAVAQDAPSMPAKILCSGGETAAKVAELLSRGMTQGAIAAELGLAKATINYHARRLGVEGSANYVGRAFVVRVLGYSGVRNSELCDLRIRHVRLHDPGGARFHVPDSKTETGIRIVEMSPDLAEGLRRSSRPPASGGQPHGAPRLRGAEHARRPDQPPARREDRPRGLDTRHRDTLSARSSPASKDDAAQSAADLHLHRSARQSLRRQVGHEPSRARRFQDDARCLRAARAAREARAWSALRRRRARRPCAASRRPDAP